MVRQARSRIDRFAGGLRRLRSAAVPVAAALLAANGLSNAVHAQEGGDLQAQILYAFHSEDLNQERELTRNLAAEVRDQGGTPDLRYHWAHAEYRYAALIAALRPAEAARALDVCVHELGDLLAVDEQSSTGGAGVRAVEARILQSACYADLSQLGTLNRMLARGKAHDRIESALKMAPRNPRALLVRAMLRLREQPGDDSIPVELRQAAEAFQNAPATSNDVPGWGHADAYLLLGHALRLRGEILTARNWIEQALIAAPDYRAAQRELAALSATSARR